MFEVTVIELIVVFLLAMNSELKWLCLIFHVWLTVHLELYLYNKPTRFTIFSLYYITTPLHVSGPFVAHHQEAECIVWQMVLVLHTYSGTLTARSCRIFDKCILKFMYVIKYDRRPLSDKQWNIHEVTYWNWLHFVNSCICSRACLVYCSLALLASVTNGS
jgi:hypothetical protein